MNRENVMFWVSADIVISDYLKFNTVMQSLSKQHEFYFLCSNGIEQVIEQYYTGNILSCVNNMSLKGKILFDELKKRTDYRILVRLDSDSIVMDIERLLKIVRSNLSERKAIIGNAKVNQYNGQKYIRGACNAVTRSSVDVIDMKVNYSDLGTFDSPFNEALKIADVELIEKDLFEQNDYYTGQCPVWHPPQIELEKRLVIFKKHQKRKFITI